MKPRSNIWTIPVGKIRKSSLWKCIFLWHMALYFECRINKNALFPVFLAILPTRILSSIRPWLYFFSIVFQKDFFCFSNQTIIRYKKIVALIKIFRPNNSVIFGVSKGKRISLWEFDCGIFLCLTVLNLSSTECNLVLDILLELYPSVMLFFFRNCG